jgi:hypothetical protein
LTELALGSTDPEGCANEGAAKSTNVTSTSAATTLESFGKSLAMPIPPSFGLFEWHSAERPVAEGL